MRVLAPALVSGDLHADRVYILAPFLGAWLGGFAYRFARGEPTRSVEVTKVEPRGEPS